MARPLRVEYGGARYHLMSRGDRRESTFWDEKDREQFIETLATTCKKCGWIVDAYCLMQNHFHLVVETPQPNLVLGMKWLLGTYTIRFNVRHKQSGHLFAGRYKSILVDESSDHYLRVVCDYVHLNPDRAGLIPDDERLDSYSWSSFPKYLANPDQRPTWLRVTRLLGEHGIEKDDRQGRREFSARIEARRADGESSEWRQIRTGWRYGAEDFRDRIDEWISRAKPSARNHVASERRESDEARAKTLIDGELAKVGWDEARLNRENKGHPVKAGIAEVLRAQTPMTIDWIARELKMGSWRTVRNLLQARRKKREIES